MKKSNRNCNLKEITSIKEKKMFEIYNLSMLKVKKFYDKIFKS